MEAIGEVSVNALFLLIGCVMGWVGTMYKLRKSDMENPKDAPHVSKFNAQKWIGGLFIFLAMFTVVQTAVINRNVEASSQAQLVLAKRVQDCNAEFQRVIAERAAANAEDVELNRSDQEALNLAVEAIIANLRGQYTLEGTADALEDYLNQNEATQRIQESNKKIREANPYPHPRCGE